ncbi:MAG: DUF554 domain-containing protein [Oscillospiraceae bacterium]|nr:DUF554 domain-containing protein [Oscillospiraceae bacterium]
MIAVFVNTIAVLAGSLIGILFRNRLRESLRSAVMKALGLCTLLIGVSSAIATKELLCVILCMVLGTVLGEVLRIDDGLEHAGDYIKGKLLRSGGENSRFTDGFVSSCILFCIGSMTIMGSLEAGIRHNYSIIFAKSLMDFMSSMAFGAAMGFGVTCSALFVLVFQGALTLLAGVIGPALSEAAVTEMSAVGGVILIGMALNLLELPKERIRVSNMLPAIFLPLLYFPIVGLFG